MSIKFDKHADYLLTNGKVYTMDSKNKVCSSLVIKGNKIIYVGGHDNAMKFKGRRTKVIDLKGKIVLPSFTDAHLHHFTTSDSTHTLDLSSVHSLEECLEAIKQYIQYNPNLDTIVGNNLDINIFHGDDRKYGPSKKHLDSITTDKPIYIAFQRSMWLNSKALEESNITKNMDFHGNNYLCKNIVKDSDGELRGIIKESAMSYVKKATYSEEDILKSFEEFQEKMHSFGITNIMPIGIDYGQGMLIDVFKTVISKDKLKLRVSYAETISPGTFRHNNVLNAKEQVNELISMRNDTKTLSDYFKVTTGKFFVDGVHTELTAFLTSPYNTSSLGKCNYYGYFNWEENWDDFVQAIKLLNENKLQTHYHSIGDGATKKVLDAMEQIPNYLDINYRNTIAHLYLIRKRDIARMKALNIIAAPQPYWHYKNPKLFENIEYKYLGERSEYTWPLQSLLAEELLATGSSDYPFNIPNPLLAIQTGATRELDNNEETLLNKCEKASVMDLVKMFTVNGAYQTFREDEIGTLEINKKADLIVLDKDIFKLDPKDISSAKVLLTFFDGEIVYSTMKNHSNTTC